MKSTELMKSRHSNTRRQYATTGFARRALLLFTFLVACVGSVWGQIYVIGDGEGLSWELPGKEIQPDGSGNYTFTINGLTEFKVSTANTTDLSTFENSSFRLGNSNFSSAVYGTGETLNQAWYGNNPKLPWKGNYTISITNYFGTMTVRTNTPKPPLDISAPIYYKGIEISGLTYEFSLIEQVNRIKEVIGQYVGYAKWYIADSNGKIVYNDNWKFEQGKMPNGEIWNPLNPDGEGVAWVAGNKIDIEGGDYSGKHNILNMKITAPEDVDLAGMKVVAIFSDEASATSNHLAICVFEFLAPDVFSGKEKTTCDATGLYITKYIDPVGTSEIPLEKDKIALATAKLPDGKRAKYARFYLLHNGELVNLKNNSPLTVEGVKNSSGETIDWQLPARPTYGYYFYNNGQELDLSGANMTLTVEAGTFPEYEIVCVLSTDAPDAVSGTEVITEPDWDVVFTYAFRNQVETKKQTGSVEWDAVTMTATIPTDDMAEKWGTSWSNLAQEQRIQWYVTDETGSKQPLVIGTERKIGTWAIDLPAPFTTDIDGKTITLTGQTMYNAASFENMWDAWGNPTIYAPADKSFADVQNYKIVCEIADDAGDSAKPNVRYTLSLSRTIFPGQEKTTIVKDTKQAKAAAGTTSANIDFTLPEGTKYARFYIVDQSGTTVNSGVWLTVEGNNQTNNADAPGWYVYDASGLTLNKIEIGSSSANLDEYQVIMITSSETAVASGSTVTYEPDYENQTTFWLNYPATLWETSGNVEWSPQSMQIVAPDIEGEEEEGKKGEGYLDQNKQHYTLQWTIVDGSGEQKPLRIGDSRVDGEWSISVSNNPFIVEGTVATVTNNSDFGFAAWNKWTAPQIYAPKNMTMKQITDAGIRFVCKFYESDEVPDDDMLAMTYTIYIDRKEVLGQLKDGGLYSEELVKGIEHDATEHRLNLGNAITAYHENFDDKKVTYVRIYLTKNDGTALDPTDGDEQFAVTGYNNDPHTFDNHKEYGYYFQIEQDINLDALAHITLPKGTFTYYNVVVAMSGDTDAAEHTGGMGSLSQQDVASVLSAYEPDFDYIYIYKFAETSPFPGSLDNLQHNHSKEVLVKTDDAQVLIPLNDKNTVAEFVSELGKSSFTELVDGYFHVRWFVAKKNPDGTYEKLPGSENMLKAVETGTEHWTEDNQGIYWNSEVSSETNQYTYVDRILKVNFTKPTDDNWSDYQVVVWITDDNTGAAKKENGTTLSQAPQNIKIQYIYNFFEEENWKFVHYKGASGRDYLTVNAEDVKYRDSRIDAVGSPLTQYDWDNATSTAFATTDDIRQSVHTVEYELYVGDEDVALSLPFQFYTTRGQDSEPSAYIRWYDYTTDLNTPRLSKIGNNLFSLKEKLDNDKEQDRGWFYLDRNKTIASNTTEQNIGMKFKASDLGEGETAIIACDVSKYYDGSYQTASDGSLTFLHEPTLSVRYIFTIRRAKVCADNIKEKADAFEEAVQGLKDGTIKYSKVKNTMFDLFENNGKTVVSLNGTSGTFSLRANLSELGYYHIYNTDGTSTGDCEAIDWYAYYEDEEGLWYKTNKWTEGDTDEEHVTQSESRIYNATFSDLTSYYHLLSDITKTKNVQNTKGATIHLIGYLKNRNAKAAAIHYELSFIDAPAVPILDLKESKETDDDYDFYFKRSRDYLDEKLIPAGAVTFDDKFINEDGSINYDKPTKWEENIREMPLEWSEAEYSFCYPSIDAYRQDNGYTGFAPQHGDYILLKSMNLPNVSMNDDGATRRWYFGSSPTLRDYTYTYKHGDADGDSDYGGFFYVDASDEARTIANLNFSASLCRGSEIHFTMAIADVTESGQTAPQVIAHVYEMAEDGTKGQLVISFVACTLKSGIIKAKNKVSNNSHEYATWYQYYGYGSIPSNIELDGTNKNFIVEIDNNSENTHGADFCVDEIRFYTKTTKLIVEQGIYDCNQTDEPPTNLYIKVEDMQSFMAIANNPEKDGKTIYWRICDRNHDPVPENEEGTLYENDKKNFGKTKMPNDVPDVSTLPYDHPNGEWGFFRKDEDGKDVVYFSLAYKRLNLEDGKRYYISVYNLGEIVEPTDDDGLWGIYTNACDVYSEFFLPRKMYITVTNGDGEDNSEVTLGCGVSSAMIDINLVLHVPDNTQASGFKSYTDFEFDYFLGTLEEFNRYSTNATIDGETKTITLLDAIKDFRAKYPKEQTLPDGYDVDGPYRSLITEASGKLLLLASDKVGNLNVSGDNNTILAIPTKWYVTMTDKNGTPRPKKDGQTGEYETVDICDPFEFIFKIISGEGGGPSLTLGFDDVDYTGKGIRVVRVGLGQIKNMQTNHLLHIPVKTFKKTDDAADNEGELSIIGNLSLQKYASGKEDQTNDEKVTANVYVATFAEEIINPDKMYVSVNFHGEGISKQDFYEGFIYRMLFLIKDAAAGDGACEGTVEFLMKVVPEYVTWNDEAVTPNANVNTNWNNDKNWSRSRKAELYKHNLDSYKDNGTGTGDNGVASTPAAFVPMKFTYVTIPSGNVAPNLIGLIRGSDGIYNNIGNDATDNIQYDLMVRMEETCQDATHHPVSSTAKVYDCEKFYGNWAKEIYFKPRAELVNQQYLTYGKAWVEKELVANTWTLMSTPLKETYAGDMYVPYESGRQETEAFKAINFTDKATKDQQQVDLYSRTKYPIYQRSWLQEGARVYTTQKDVRATSYSAALKGSITEKLSLWSHAYSDVTEKYSQWTGFAIRAHKQAQDNLALIRLPKEDTNYDYYKWDGNVPEDGQVKQKVDKSATGRLFTDGAEDGTVQIPVGTVQTAHDYLLVGNPYVCSVDMAKFLKVNENILENKYWTYEHNTVANPYTTGSVKPLQAFFVKVKDSDIDGDTPITFTQAMMMDGNTNPIAASARAMTMTAANERGQSSASVSLGEETKSVETLFDSNLTDVPMVYTVADGQAVSVNQVTETGRPIAFGVTCDGSEPVAVTFSDIELLTTGELYVVDAVTGEQTAVDEGCTLSIQPNDYGRYFLLTRALGSDEQVDVQKGIVISVRGREVTVASGEALTLVRALSPDGTTVHQDAGGGTTASFVLASGVYVVKAENAAGEQQTVKIVVK